MKYLEDEGRNVELRENRKVFLLFYMVGFFVGIIYANTISRDYVDAIGIFNEYFLNQYVQTEINEKGYIWYLVRLRILPLCVMFGIGLTRVGKMAVFGFLLWTGFLSGLIVSSAIIKMGMIGTILCIVAFFPQMIFYFGAYAILLWSIYQFPKSKWNSTKIMMILLITCIGIITECYVNPMLLKMFLKRV